MPMTNTSRRINVAIAGLGNCAGSLIEGIYSYRQHPGYNNGLLFPILADYSVRDIEVVAAFDISALKVGRLIREAIYQRPNNFARIPDVKVHSEAQVFRGPTLDGNPEHLARFVPESEDEPVKVAAVLKDLKVDVLLNMLPTGSIQATEYYARVALEAGCSFVNCIPTVIAQKLDFQNLFKGRGLPLLGDDIKSQLGSTILHHSLLQLLEFRGARLRKTSQINIGGNTDFANFVYRAETKLVSKRRSLERYIGDAEFHVGHHYDPTRGNRKTCLISLEASVFGNSKVQIAVRLDSDDKPNAAGSTCDLIRIAKGALDSGIAGCVPEACAFYMKSPPSPMDELEALDLIRARWTT